MTKFEVFFKRHTPTILSIFSGIGVATTTILAVKATPKAVELIKLEENKKQDKLTKVEIVKTAWKCYIPTGISMLSTLTCIFGSQYLNMKHQASLISAYTVLDKAYKDYVKKTEEIYGDDAKKIKGEVAKDVIDIDKIDLQNDQHLFFDYQTMRYFDATFDQVLEAEQRVNQELAATGYVSVNDFYRYLGLPGFEYSKNMGWTDEGHYHEMKFEHQRIEMDDGLECWIIITEEPLIDYYNG